jgi:hypothetical protein
LGKVAGATGRDAFELLFELLLLLLLFEEPFDGAFGVLAGLVEAAVLDRVVGGGVASLRACVLSGRAVPETPLPNAPPAPMPPPAAKPPPDEPPVRGDKVRPLAFRAGERYDADGEEPLRPLRLR